MQLYPSMMCADFTNLKYEIELLDKAGIDSFHIDLMDGHYVPNFGMGIQDIEAIRKCSDSPIDVHLMIEDPGKYIPLFKNLGVNLIYIHPETSRQPYSELEKIKKQGMMCGIAISPGISVGQIEEFLPIADYVMVMTVNPGFAGQAYIENMDRKITRLIELKNRYSYCLNLDGAISASNIAIMSHKGVDGFVLGTSALFGKMHSYEEIIEEIRKLEASI